VNNFLNSAAAPDELNMMVNFLTVCWPSTSTEASRSTIDFLLDLCNTSHLAKLITGNKTEIKQYSGHNQGDSGGSLHSQS